MTVNSTEVEVTVPNEATKAEPSLLSGPPEIVPPSDDCKLAFQIQSAELGLSYKTTRLNVWGLSQVSLSHAPAF